MSRYWFFASTLPGFAFGAAPPLSEADFLSACRRNLTHEDMAEIARIPEVFGEPGRPSGFRSSFLAAFVAWERGFRNELALLRSREHGTDPSPWMRDAVSEPTQAQAAAACFAARDPLEAELAVERERWGAAERLCSLHTFDLDAIAAYRLKLAINSRIQSFDRGRGAEGYARLYRDILGPAGTGGAESTLSGVQA